MRFYNVNQSIFSAVLECDYKIIRGGSYVCYARNLTVNSKVTVVGVIGTHLQGKSNVDVKTIDVTRQNCVSLPSGIEKFFSNLTEIVFYGSKLSSLSALDLKPFSNLTKLFLVNNLIKSLPADLFMHTPKVKSISIQEDFLVAIDKTIFNSLQDLSYFYFVTNKCNVGVAYLKDRIPAIIQRFVNEC